MLYLVGFFVIALGLISGSFISALSWRLPREISISKGRSICDNCGKNIAWYDNIPLISYLLLKGKCRNCTKQISVRYPIIEGTSAGVLLLVYFIFQNCSQMGFVSNIPSCGLINASPLIGSLIVGILLLTLLTVLIIDLEQMIIPDSLVFVSFILFLIYATLTGNFWAALAAGFGSGLFLLTIYLLTQGKGMGLGDVKLVIPLGAFLGWPNVLEFFLVAFLTGACVGVILILLSRASVKTKLPFGPFLIIAFVINFLVGNFIRNLLNL